MKPLPVVLFVTGVVLVYAAVKNKDPRDVVREALGRKAQNQPQANIPPPGTQYDQPPYVKPNNAPSTTPGTVWTNV